MYFIINKRDYELKVTRVTKTYYHFFLSYGARENTIVIKLNRPKPDGSLFPYINIYNTVKEDCEGMAVKFIEVELAEFITRNKDGSYRILIMNVDFVNSLYKLKIGETT